MVSILVTMLLLIVISLIVLGFAQISRRNQRQSLDRQLSTQAFYAAETGINDVRDLIRQSIDAGTAISAKTDCDSASVPAYAPPKLTPTIDATNNISYSCVMVDPTPASLEYGTVDATSIVVPLVATSGNIANVNISWKSKTTGSPITGCPVTTASIFTPTGPSWSCGYGVLRMDLVNTSGALLSAAGLQAGTMTAFLVPQNGVGSNAVAFVAGSANTNNRLGVRCSNTDCNLRITGLNSTQYYLRISSIYKEAANLRVVASDASSAPLRIQGAQAIIDATGKAQDVLRRVQVRVPLTASSTNLLPDYALQSTDAICKRFATMDNYFRSFAASTVAGLTSVAPNSLCL
jgi:Tfp pilus assembly protein PilX